MSSHKKLRLDNEAQNQANLSGANPNIRDGINRSYLDNSSLSSSTSGGGGNGNYGRSPGPFRRRYSRPLDIPSPNSNSLSRFSPYYFGKERRTSLKVPLIRARRDESEQDGVLPSSRISFNSSIGADTTTTATSTTAQRIIETLQNLSTPVLNAGKIRIDQDIKAVLPIALGPGSGSPMLRTSPGNLSFRSSGPPKTCSSLLLSNPSSSNQISPMGDQRRLFCIPKMIDAATNTDKEGEVMSPKSPFANKFGTESKSTTLLPSQLPAFNLGTASAASKPTTPFHASKDGNNSDDEFHECNSEFAFSSAWSSDVFEGYLSDKPGAGKSIPGSSPSILNGYKEIPTTVSISTHSSEPVSLPLNSQTPFFTAPVPMLNEFTKSPSTPFIPSISQPQSSAPFMFGTSPLRGNNQNQTSVLADKSFESEGKSGDSGGINSSNIFKPTSPGNLRPSLTIGAVPGIFGSLQKPDTLVPTLPFGSGTSTVDTLGKSNLSPSTDKVDAAGKLEKSPVVPKESPAATIKNPLPPLSSISAGTKWRCPTCMVENELQASACVCCSEKNPNAKAISAPTTKKWRCPTCMVENVVDASQCVCCSEKNPNLAPLVKPVSNKWSCPTCMVENPPTAMACVCCSEKNPNDNSGSTPVAATPANGPAPTFKFGITASTSSNSTSNANSAFTFGNESSSDAQKASIPTFKFGAPAPAVSTIPIPSTLPSVAPPSTATNSPVSFGINTTNTATSPASKPTFSFSAPVSTSAPITSTNVQPVSSLNTSTSTPTPAFGLSKPTIASNNTPTTGTLPLFGTGSQQSTPLFGTKTSLSFGGAPTTNSDPPKPAFTFGAQANAKPVFGSFSFSSATPSSVPALPTTPAVAAPAPTLAPTPNFTFNSNPSTIGSFGLQTPTTASALQPQAGFSFGGSASVNPSASPALPSFSMTPNMNFSAATPSAAAIPFGNPTPPNPTAGSQPPPVLFQFTASIPSESPGGRKIKKAVRRFNK